MSSGMSSVGGDRGPLLNVINWILLVVTCITCLLKIVSKYIMAHRIHKDDVYMAGAMVLTVAYGVAVTYEVAAGLGRGPSGMDIANRVEFERAAFTAQIFYVLSLSVAKIAILQFMSTLARGKRRKMIVHGFIALCAVWAFVGVLCVAFQCRIPRTWEVLSRSCFNQRQFWDYNGVTDIFIDLAISLVPIYLLHDLRMKLRKKMWVMSAFAVRVLLIPVVAVRLSHIQHAQNNQGHFADDFNIALVTIIHTNLNVIVTCLPFVKPVSDILQTGILASDLPRAGSTGRMLYEPPSLQNLWQNSKQDESTGSKAVSVQDSRSSEVTNGVEEQIIVEREFSVTYQSRTS